MKYINDVQAVVDLIPALYSLLKYYTAHLQEKVTTMLFLLV